MLKFLIVAIVVSVAAFLGFTWVAEALTGTTLPQVTNDGVYMLFSIFGFTLSAILAD